MEYYSAPNMAWNSVLVEAAGNTITASFSFMG